MNELKPCPFCGGEAELIEERTDYSYSMFSNYNYYIKCINNCCEQPREYKSPQEAIEAWNKRSEQKCQKE